MVDSAGGLEGPAPLEGGETAGGPASRIRERVWRGHLAEHRQRVAYADRSNWRAALDAGFDALERNGAPLEAALDLLDAADGWTRRSGCRGELELELAERWGLADRCS